MRFRELVNESKTFENWTQPSKDNLAQEYHVEYEIKPALRSWLDDAWPTLEDFLSAVDRAQIIEVSDQLDQKIQYRSRTNSREELRSLISGYRSWPEFRNDQTLDALYTGFKENRAMIMPIVIKYQGQLRIMAGNTRMDVAQQLGITPKVLLVTVD